MAGPVGARVVKQTVGQDDWSEGDLIANDSFSCGVSEGRPDALAPGGGRLRQTLTVPLEEEIAREAQR